MHPHGSAPLPRLSRTGGRLGRAGTLSHPRLPALFLQFLLLHLLIAPQETQAQAATAITTTASPATPALTQIGKPFRLHLRSGDRISGTIVRETAAALTLSNAILGTLTLPLSQIERREPLLALPVLPATAAMTATNQPAAPGANTLVAEADPVTRRRLNDLLAAYLSGHLSTEQYHRQRAKLIADFATATAKASQPTAGPGSSSPGSGKGTAGSQTAAAKKPPAAKAWSGEAQMGTDLGFGQKERQLYTGRLKLNYVQAPVRNSLDYLFTYGRTDGELSANRMDGSMKTDFDLGHDYYAYSLEGAGYDQVRKIDWRYEIGPGIGYHLVKKTNFVLRVETGFHYEVHNFQDNRQDDIYYHRIAQDLRWNLGTLICRSSTTLGTTNSGWSPT